ncbi:MAG: hypothetical protein LBQ77_07415 [Treponema sp.]|nr:hypothetical protein [Treponema sp.]
MILITSPQRNGREIELQSPHTKTLFVQVIAETHRKYAFKLWNFCIMDNLISISL